MLCGSKVLYKKAKQGLKNLKIQSLAASRLHFESPKEDFESHESHHAKAFEGEGRSHVTRILYLRLEFEC